MGLGTGCARILLFAFTICFFIVGIGFMAGGIWILASQDSALNVLNLISNQAEIDGATQEQIQSWASQKGVVQTAAIIMTAAGGLVMLISFFGCCGAVKESKCLLGMFVGCIVLILAAQVAAVVLFIRYRSVVEDNARSGLKLLQNKYLVSVNDFVNKQQQPQTSVSIALNYLFVSAKCCGAAVAQDAANSTSWKSSNRTWTATEQMTIPAACCPVKETETSKVLSGQWGSLKDSLENVNCPVNKMGAYNQDCVKAVTDLIGTYSLWVIIGAAALAAIQMFVIIFTVCLICSIEE